jgi:hypothetical protein
MIRDAGQQLVAVVRHVDECFGFAVAECRDDLRDAFSVRRVQHVQWFGEDEQLGVLHKSRISVWLAAN